jgi:hypothetical protein
MTRKLPNSFCESATILFNDTTHFVGDAYWLLQQLFK